MPLSLTDKTKKIAIILFFFLISFLFFSNLFFPKLSLFFTPDFNRSDVFDIQYALKSYLGQSLKRGEVPLWTNLIASGFPLLAEGQMGAFYLPNLILFFLLPPVLAFNLSYVLSFFFAAVGMFLVSRYFKLSFLVSFFTSLIFTFSGFFITHIRHLNLLQAASLLPWLFFFALNFYQQKKVTYLLIFSLILSQQIFTGHFQTVFISLITIFLFFVFKSFDRKPAKNTFLLFLSLAVVFSFLLAAIQLVPSLELTGVSVRSQGFPFEKATNFPYPYSFLLTFVLPFVFGNPYQGSFAFSEDKLGIFWENTAYLGVIPLALALGAVFNSKFKHKKALLLPLVIAFLLIFGKNSPLYFLFTLKPLNMFRIPSRFLLLVVFNLSLAAGLNLEKLKKKLPLTLIYLLIAASLAQLVLFRLNYPDTVINSKEALTLPTNAKEILAQNNPAFWLSHKSQNKVWYNHFSQGWQDNTPFLNLRNSLSSYSNLVFNLPSINHLEDNSPQTSSYYLDLIEKSTKLTDAKDALIISPITLKLLKLASVANILTPLPIINLSQDHELKEVENETKVHLYQLKNTPLQYRFVKNLYQADTLTDFAIFLANLDYPATNSATITSVFKGDKQFELPLTSPKLIEEKDNLIKLELKAEKPAFLLLTRSYYPGWKAYLNNIQVPIYPVNINFQGIEIPPGEHILKVHYSPLSFKLGALISFTTGGAAVGLLFLFVNKSPKTDWLSARQKNS